MDDRMVVVGCFIVSSVLICVLVNLVDNILDKKLHKN
jgi:hypothetical protein